MPVSPRERTFLLQNLAKLENVTASNRATRVALIEKPWHTALISWLKLRNAISPGPIATARLTVGKVVNSALIYGVDFEVVEHSMWEHLVRIFGEAAAVLRHFVLHPVTKRPTVLMRPVQVRIDLDGRVMRKAVEGDWKIADVKNQLCDVLGLNPLDYTVYVDGKKLAEALTINFINARYPGIWEMRKESPALAAVLPPVLRSLATNVNSPPQSKSRLSSQRPTFPDSGVLELKHVGLRNLGNTCFFNSAVQCLLRIRPLFEYLITGQFCQQINRVNPEGSGGRIATAFRQFAEAMCVGAGHAVSPSGLHSEICRKYPIFGDYGQHDSQELLGALLDGLHEDLNQAFAAKGGQPRPNLSSEADPWEIHLSRNSSHIVELFHGALGSSIECPKCCYKKILRDPFSILSIPIPRKATKSVSLESCLEAFTASEVLDVHNEWKCDKCKKMVQATKRTGVHKCSTVLIIHLKRFEGSGWLSKKVGTAVTYPDVLDSGVFTGQSNGPRYTLIGAVFHGGTLHGGHYTSAAFDQHENQWYAYNDSHASPIDPEEAHSEKAYILFYIKSST